MKFLRFALVALGLVFSSQAFAASVFWVGGTGTWDGTTTTGHWATASGGAASAITPGANDDAIFDGSSGSGTVTLATTVNISGINFTNFTGTFDNTISNNAVTLNGSATFTGLNISGTSTRTIKFGAATWTVNTTSGTVLNLGSSGLTLNTTGATIVIGGTPSNFREVQLGGQTINALTHNTSGSTFARTQIDAGTIGTWRINSISDIFLNGNVTVSTALFVAGSASNSVATIHTLDATSHTITLNGTSSITWAAIGGVTFTGSPTASNSFDLGGNGGITINGPSGGSSSGHCIGC